MAVHLYLSLLPEALIASMLPPEQFGQYYATGHQYKSKGQAMFFEIDPAFRSDAFYIDEAVARCVAHPDGTPKNSVYVSVYRVLEHIPVNVIGKLYLSTAYGQTLAIDRKELVKQDDKGLHLYQDLAPVNSLVVSSLPPVDHYNNSVTVAASKFIHFPALCFVELGLGELATNPQTGSTSDLPYTLMHHLREALIMLHPETKTSKLVHRVHSLEFPYRMVKGGFYVGNGNDLAFYAMPSHDDLRKNHATWWRLANASA
jgi:hypothetical protein